MTGTCASSAPSDHKLVSASVDRQPSTPTVLGRPVAPPSLPTHIPQSPVRSEAAVALHRPQPAASPSPSHTPHSHVRSEVAVALHRPQPAASPSPRHNPHSHVRSEVAVALHWPQPAAERRAVHLLQMCTAAGRPPARASGHA
eukprot:357193-Chlamydomonas_euryale.AAC.1